MVRLGIAGSIINVTSIEAYRAAPGFAVYASCKAAMENFARTMALEAGHHGIRFNTIAPDATPTPGTTGIGVTTPGRPGRARSIPAGREGVEDDYAGPTVFLASDHVGLPHRHHPPRRWRHLRLRRLGAQREHGVGGVVGAMPKGDVVLIKASRGEPGARRIWDDSGDAPYVCLEAYWERWEQYGVEPGLLDRRPRPALQDGRLPALPAPDGLRASKRPPRRPVVGGQALRGSRAVTKPHLQIVYCNE